MGIPSSSFWKFRTIEPNTFKLLLNQELWFSHPKMFNDPFDTNLDIKKVINLIRHKLRNCNLLDQEIEKYTPIYNEYLKSRFVFCANKESSDFKPYNEVLMWSHYANEHKGICLGLSMASVLEKLHYHSNKNWEREEAWRRGERSRGTNVQVYYGIESLIEFIHNVDLTLERGNKWVYLMFDKHNFIKSKNWEYEREHRFIIQDITQENTGVAVPFDAKDLENIIFGLRTPLSDQMAITNIIKDKGWKHVKLWKAEQGAGLFDLQFHLI